MAPTIVVVVPFFQRESGILTKALESVFSQQGVDDFQVYIVDDESPIPVECEIREFPSDRIRVFKQKNKGCGAARNTALEHIPSGTQYVALLDSDDSWTEHHLSNALVALRDGYDFYFTNHYQLNQTVGAFERDHRLDLRIHKKLAGAQSLYGFCGDMYDQVIRKNLMGPSTNVYDFAKFRDVRFREGFRSLGEEYCFWLDLSLRGARFAFSTDCECIYGAGVNIYSVAPWGSTKSLVRTHDEILFWKLVRTEYPLTGGQDAHLNSKINRLRTEFLLELSHQMLHLNPVPPWLLMRHLRRDPTILMSFPRALRQAMR